MKTNGEVIGERLLLTRIEMVEKSLRSLREEVRNIARPASEAPPAEQGEDARKTPSIIQLRREYGPLYVRCPACDGTGYTVDGDEVEDNCSLCSTKGFALADDVMTTDASTLIPAKCNASQWKCIKFADHEGEHVFTRDGEP